jgi:hypothetical protein
MFYVLQNESTAARRRVPILLTDAATGTTAQSGVALTNIYAYVNINGGAFIGGTGAVAEAGFGQYYYEYEANEVATLGLSGIHITAAGCRDYDAISQIAAFDLYSASAGGGISAADVWNYTITNTGQSADDTLANASQSASSADSNANLAVTQTANIAFSVWGEDIGTGLLSPFAAGTAGTILYTLGQAGVALTAGDVWDYASRTITGGIADTVQLVSTPVDVSYPSMAGLANTIWSTDVSGYTNPSAGYDLTQAASGGLGLTAGDVWEYDISGILTAGSSGKQLNTAATPSGSGISAYDVWDFNITGFGGTNSAAVYVTNTNFTVGNIETYVANQTPQDVWTYAGIEGRTITGGLADTVTTLTNPANVTTGSMTGIAGTVWSVASRTITGGTATTVTNPVDVTVLSQASIATEVWNDTVASYSTHGTFGYNVLRSDQASKSGDVTLYSAGGTNGIDADIHRIDNDTDAAVALKNILTGIGSSITGNITGNLSGSVGSVTSDVNVSEVSMSGIANTVWSTDVSGYTSPSAGFDLSNASSGAGLTAGDVWTYATRTITGGIADTVTTITDRSGFAITGGTVDTVTNPVDVSTSSMSGIANTVWATDVSGYTSPSAGFDLSNASSGSGLTAGDVWSYATRTITGGIADTVTTLTDRSGFAITGGTITTVSDKTGYSLSASQTFNVTGNITGNLSGSVGSVAGNVSGSVASVVGNVGGSVNSVLSDVPVNESLISADVWGYATRTLTSGAGISAADVWSYATRTVTGGTIDNANVTSLGSTALSGIATSVWRLNFETQLPVYSVGEAGYELQFQGLRVWSQDITGAIALPNSAANYLDTAASGAGVTAGDVWTYSTRTLTSGGSGISAADVWTYGSRTITGGIADTVTDVTNKSGFAITGGTITTVSDKTGYSLSGSQSFNMTGNITGNLSGSVGSVTNPVTVGTNNDKTGYALSTAGVNAVQSGLSTLTQAQVGTEVDSSLSDVGLTSTVTGRIDATVSSRLASASYTAPPTEAAIAGTVWNYATRTLTSGGGATAGDVWTYPTRSLTSGAGITVNAATNIINGPYFVKSNVDSQDGTLDVIRGMVQDIQLTVTDAFQNPFDTTALGLAVNFYDQAGTLTTSYATTELYGPAGLVQFTLDTAVTANEGRYNLILSAAGSGNTIKFGPLQTLVRPF